MNAATAAAWYDGTGDRGGNIDPVSVSNSSSREEREEWSQERGAVEAAPRLSLLPNVSENPPPPSFHTFSSPIESVLKSVPPTLVWYGEPARRNSSPRTQSASSTQAASRRQAGSRQAASKQHASRKQVAGEHALQ